MAETSRFIKMLDSPEEFYFMLLEESEENTADKVKFSSFVKVLEVSFR